MQREHITLQRELIELIRPKPKRSRLSFTPEEKAVIAEMYDQGRSFTEIAAVTSRAQGAIRYQIALITHARKEADDARRNESHTLFAEEA